MKGALISGLLLLAACATSNASAQNPEPEHAEDERVCIGALYVFIPSLEQTKAIQTTPVPAGAFRDHSPDSCSSGPLPGDLISWHLQFGTEASALAAADAVAARVLAGARQSSIREDLGTWWKTALRNYDSAKQALARDPANKTLKWSLRIAEGALFSATESADAYRNVATYYLEIADAFGSRRALSEAERIFAMESEALTFLAEDVFRNPHPYLREHLPGLVADDIWRHPIPRVPLRAAVLRARLLDTPEAIDAAIAQLRQAYTPAMREAYRLIHERNEDDICRIPDRMPVLTEACDATPDFLYERVPAFIQAATQLEIVISRHRDRYPLQWTSYDPADPASRPGPFSVPEMLRWLEARWSDDWDGFGNGWREMTKHQFMTLLLLQADLAAEEQADRGSRRDYEGIARLLVGVASRVPPDQAPTIFRRIGERYLANHQAELAAVEAGVYPSDTDERTRTASYFRHTLESLDAIAAGE